MLCSFFIVSSLTRLRSSIDVIEVISGHGTAGHPLCYQPLTDPRSAVGAGWWDMFFFPSASAFHSTISMSCINSPICTSTLGTHRHTRQTCAMLPLVSSLHPRSCSSTGSSEVKERADHKSSKINTLKTEEAHCKWTQLIRPSPEDLYQACPAPPCSSSTLPPLSILLKQESCTALNGTTIIDVSFTHTIKLHACVLKLQNACN